MPIVNRVASYSSNIEIKLLLMPQSWNPPCRCIVSGCPNNGDEAGKKKAGRVQYFTFPKKDDALRSKWISQCCSAPNQIDHTTARVCSAHFSSQSFQMPSIFGKPLPWGRSQAKLRDDAVPTENLPSSEKSTEFNCSELKSQDDSSKCSRLSEKESGTKDSNTTEGADVTESNGQMTKRSDYLEWSEYFMLVALLSSMRSKDPNSQVGACIVNKEKRIVGIGYNGMPSGCSDDTLPWTRKNDDILKTKYPYVCHAEMNAIMNKISADIKGCTMYVVLFPCNECAKLIIQAGISQIYYLSDKYKDKPEVKASKILFDMAGVKYEKYVPKRTKITLDFNIIDKVNEDNLL